MKEVEGHGEYTYKNLKDRVNRMGNALYALGAHKGDRVAILSQNSFEYIESALECSECRADICCLQLQARSA